jgi:SAM-dependent methyltransferase
MKSKSDSVWVYLRNGIGITLSKVGERIGNNFLIYNPMVMRRFHDQALRDAPIVIGAVLDVFPHLNFFVDVGSGSGAFSAELLRRSKRVVALEHSPSGRRIAVSHGVDCRPFNLTNSPPAKVDEHPDAVICFEVGEHLSEELGASLVRYITQFRAPVVYSAAQPGQGGTGHVNEQRREYWIRQFESFDFLHSVNLSESFRDTCKKGGASEWFWNNPIVLIPMKNHS